MKCDFCDQSATRMIGETNGVLACDRHVNSGANARPRVYLDALDPLGLWAVWFPGHRIARFAAWRQALDYANQIARGEP